MSGLPCRVEVDVPVLGSLVLVERIVGDVGWGRGCSALRAVGDVHVVVAGCGFHDCEVRSGSDECSRVFRECGDRG